MKKLLCLLSLCLCVNTLAQTVYFEESSRYPFERTIITDQSSADFSYSAFFRSPVATKEEITLAFSVDNSLVKVFNDKQGTGYEPLPKSAYKMGTQSAVIAAGSVKAETGTITVKGGSCLKPGKTYLLPVRLTVKNGPAVAEEGRDVIYYKIVAKASPKNSPRILAGKVENSYKSAFVTGKSIFFFYPDGSLVEYELKGKSLSKPAQWKVPGDFASADYLCPFTSGRVIAHYRQHSNGQLWAYKLDFEKNSILPEYNIFGTSGYNIFKDITVLGNDLYCRKPDGELMIYPLTDNLEWGGAGVRSLGSGWDKPLLFGMDGKLLCADADGVLWSYPLNSRGETGIPKKIGEEWGIYVDVLPFQGGLLGIDAEGKVWKFNIL